MKAYMIALEGGGTRSQAALMGLDGKLIQTGEAREVNTNFTTFQQAQQAVQGAVGKALHAAGVQGEQVTYLVSALVGPKFGAETLGELCPQAQYRYYGERDVVFARAGIYRPHGVGVVAATGATAFGMRCDDGRQVSLGGWGSLLGDEGSAYALGLLGLRAAVRAFEAREASPTGLVEAVGEALGLTQETFHRGLIELAYQKPLSRAEIAGLASVVTRLASNRDVVAKRITDKVANDLAALGLHAARRLFCAEETFVMVTAGGLVNAGDLILGPLRQGLARAFPRAEFKIGTEQPAVALGRLALYHLKQSEALC